ncbi:MAG: MBL fold metallo-hydrolase [Roseateles depolymerans]|uniref:MBL fold metallo-hydrolase n=1 Tax=Roseateles depolymerans TaxID=76731 RepID=A0A2W5FJY0_9BURK|nr:MAG: MBL fold metallo-hydrolase [Roseateles depolymerans]
MRFRSLGSGSGGNATLIEASQGITQTRLLVDAGFSERELVRRLARAGLEPADLDALFITHEHGDHVGCSVAFAQRHRLPLITSRGTWRAIGSDRLDTKLLHLTASEARLEWGDLALLPFAVPHDAQEPLQLVVEDGQHRLGIVTDLGCAPESVSTALSGCAALLLECNHDEELLRNGPYPASLKRRILGTHGHLSNAAAADLLARCRHARLGPVVAAHLSDRNNTPALATQALAGALDGLPADITVADPTEGTDWIPVPAAG